MVFNVKGIRPAINEYTGYPDLARPGTSNSIGAIDRSRPAR